MNYLVFFVFYEYFNKKKFIKETLNFFKFPLYYLILLQIFKINILIKKLKLLFIL